MSNTTINGASRESWWPRRIHQLTGPSRLNPAAERLRRALEPV